MKRPIIAARIVLLTALAAALHLPIFGDGQEHGEPQTPRESKRHPKLESLVRPLLRVQWQADEAAKRIEEIEKLIAADSTFRSELGQVAAAFVRTDSLEAIPTDSVRARVRQWAKTHAPKKTDALKVRPASTRTPEESWMKYRDVKEAGFSTERLGEVRKHLATSNIDGLLVAYDGAVLLRHGDIETRFMCHSVRKSFMSLLYGIYEAEGKIDLTKTLADLDIDDIEPSLTDDEKQATIADLLKSRSGIYHPAAYEPAHMMKTRPGRGSHAPGTHWWYNNWDFNALLTIFEQETGEKFFEAFHKRIAAPLQLQDFRQRDGYYHHEPKRSMHPAYPFRLSGRDMARIGLLMSRGGKWGDKQIVPAAWVDESTRAHSDIPNWHGYGGYGYMWWVGRSQDVVVFSALGNGNHSIDALPDRNLVFVFRANTYKKNKISWADRWQVIQGVLRAQTGPSAAKSDLVPLQEKNLLPKAVELTDDYLAQFPLDLRRQLPQNLPPEIRDQPVRIELVDSALVLHTAKPPALQFDLIPVTKDRFFMEGANTIGVIDRDGSGKPTRFLVKSDLVAHIAELKKAKQPDSARKVEELAERLFGYQEQNRATVIRDSVRQLVELQIDGAPWTYEGNYRRGGGIPVTYQVGGTSLASLAILYGADKDDEEALAAIRNGLKFVLEQTDHPMMKAARTQEYDMRVLAQAYALLFLRHIQMKDMGGDLTDRIAPAISKLTKALVFEQMNDGGWNYQARPVHASFVTASVVQALLWSRPVSDAVTDNVLSRAAAALESSRYDDGGYLYFGTRKSKRKRDVQDQLPGSIARAAICETMLSRLGKGSNKRIEQAITSFYRHWDQLEARRAKPGTHDGPYMIAPYYFYYGHRYAAQAVELLPERRPAERQRMFELLMRTRSSDGLWNDRDYSRSRGYSTAMVLLALMSKEIGLPPKWEPSGDDAASTVPEAHIQRPEKYRSDPKKVMVKNVYIQFPNKTIKNVTPTPGEGFYGGACIHPAGRDVVFPGATWGYSRIWKYIFATGKVIPLTPKTYASINPSYSADGKHIVFASDRDLDSPRFDMFEVGRSRPHNDGFKGGMTSGSNLYVMDADGGNIRRLTSGEDFDRRPSFSPDGQTVVFLSSRGAKTLHMWTVPTNGSAAPAKLKLEGNLWAGRPRYSLDGKAIFFFSGISDGKYKPTGRHTLCRVPATGGAWQILSSDTVGVSSHGPDPDPNGTHLWYHAAVDKLWGIYKLPLAGGDPVRFVPRGFKKHHIAHPTIARDGTISFDSRSYVKSQ